MPIRWLAVLVAVVAAALVHLAVTGDHGDLIGGRSLDAHGIRVGATRVVSPFFAGVLLMRLGVQLHACHAFAIASVLLVAC